MLRVAVLASGRGSNFSALLAASRKVGANYQIVGLYSDQADAPALAVAREAGLDAAALNPRDHTDRTTFDVAFFQRVLESRPDLIVCAGYMRIISAAALATVTVPVINIHPSLLPRYPGLHTHAKALKAGDTEHGASVHVVTAELDAGPLIAQVRIPILPDDTPDTLATRLLTHEHQLLPACVAEIAAGRLQLSSHQVQHDGRTLTAPLQWQDSQLNRVA